MHDLPASARIHGRQRFKAIYESRCSAADARIVMYALPNGRQRSRLGVVVGRKHGTAVRRNRLKRLLREAFRLVQAELPGGMDFVVIPRVGGHPTVETLSASLRSVARRAVGRGRRRGSGAADDA